MKTRRYQTVAGHLSKLNTHCACRTHNFGFVVTLTIVATGNKDLIQRMLRLRLSHTSSSERVSLAWTKKKKRTGKKKVCQQPFH